MKKKIKDLTDFERREICDKHVYDKCVGCPFMLEARNNGQDSDVVVKYCVHHILNVLDREVEEHHENYETGYFLEDKPGHSVVRGSFESIEKAKKYAAEHNMSWWRVVGYNYTTNGWDVLAQSEQKELL